MLKTILFTLLIVAICLLLLCLKIIGGGRFPNTHVSGNKALRKRGIGCVQSQDREEQRKPDFSLTEIEKKMQREIND